MAKSLRSKWRRKMRNIKRERYGKKELIRLKKMLGLPIDDDTTSSPAGDVEMKTEPEMSEIANVITARDARIIRSIARSGCDPDDSEVDDEIMEITKFARAKKIRSSYLPRLKRLEKKKWKKGGNRESSTSTSAETAGASAETAGASTETAGASTETAGASTSGGEAAEGSQERYVNLKTFMDQYGSFPVWINKKLKRQLSRKNKRMKKWEKKKELKRHRRGSYSKASMAKETVGLEEAISGMENVAVATTTGE